MLFTPSDIKGKTFSPSRYGYDTAEVDVFLDSISEEISELFIKIADQKADLESFRQQLEELQRQNSQLKRNLEDGKAQAAKKNSPVFEQQASHLIAVAQKTADELVTAAQVDANRIRNEADQKARETIRQALAEKRTALDEVQTALDDVKRMRLELRDLQERQYALELTTDVQSNQRASSAASLSEDFPSVIRTIFQLDPNATNDATLLLNYFADLAPQMEAELALLRVAYECGAIKTLTTGLANESSKTRAKRLLISGFINPIIANELIETISKYYCTHPANTLG